MNRLMMILFLLFFCTVAHAEALKDTHATKSLTDKIMARVAGGEIKGGIEMLRPYILFPMSELDAQLEQLAMQIPVIDERFGQAVGHDFLRKEELGESLIRYVYLQKFERHTLVWRFTFYRSGNQWLLNGFKYDDNIDALFLP